MKRLIPLLILLIPSMLHAQVNFQKSSPFDYMWKNVGNAGFSAGEAESTSLAFSPSGEPYVAFYVAFMDWGNFSKATVMKFDGTNWVNVGNAGFSAGPVAYTSLAFSPSGEPYVAYVENGTSGKATVMKFNGTNWVNVGNAGFSAGMAGCTSLAFSPLRTE